MTGWNDRPGLCPGAETLPKLAKQPGHGSSARTTLEEPINSFKLANNADKQFKVTREKQLALKETEV